LPGKLGEIFLDIENQVIALNAEWHIYQQLFENEEDWQLLVQSSAYGWAVLHDALVERCIFRITRLIDRDKRTVSIPNLIRIARKEGVCDLGKALDADVDALKKGAKKLKKLRNNVLAHHNYDVAIGRRAYPIVSMAMIKSLIGRITDLCQSFRRRFGLDHFAYDMLVGAWADGITASFRRLQRFEELRKQVRRGELSNHELRQAILNMGRGLF